jgi:O-antigen biosynthesis protein
LSNGSALWPWLTMTREVSAVTGACLLMPRAVFDDIGGFDEGFPVNYNDVDLCLRAAQKGYRIVLEARAKLEHAESATRAIGIRYAERQRFLDRWSGVLRKGDPYFNPNLTDNELLLPDPEAHARLHGTHI